MSLSLRARDVSWETPDGRLILDGLDLHLSAGSHALVGPNGIGKTTLLEILAGLRPATRGVVEASGPVGYLPQTRAAHDDQPVGEALGARSRLAALTRIDGGDGTEADFALVGDAWDLPERVSAVLDQLALPQDLDRSMGTLSGGQQSRVWLGRLLLQQPDFLLLDEPTNHLDREGRDALLDALASFKGGLLVASHDRWLLRRLERMVSLETTGLRIFDCSYDAWRQAREAERRAALDAYETADLEAKRIQRAAEATRVRHEQQAARGRRSRKTGSQPKLALNFKKEQSETTGARLGREREERLHAAQAKRAEAWAAVEEADSMRLDLAGTQLSERRLVASLTGVGFSFGETRVLEGIDLELLGPTRVALLGPNGCGKTTLARIIVGDLAPTEGTIRRGTVRVAWLDQTTRTLNRDESVLANLLTAAPTLDQTAARWLLARFRFRDDTVHKPVSVLSGGERMRAALAVALNSAEPPQLLVLDEPTNNLDLDSRLDLETALQAYRGALLVISHDDDLLEALQPDQVLRLEPAM
jgi:ATPase subunit of ABC transporter with duplicated ATPase domains